MFYSKESLRIQLQLLAEGAASGAGSEGTGVNGPAAGDDSGVDLSDIQYGIQDDGQDAAAGIDPANRDAEFEKLIKGDFKDQYNKRVQDTLQKRFKGMQETINKYEQTKPLVEKMASKYGVDADDIEGLIKATDDDISFYEDEALEKGLSVEQLKEIKKMERENAELKRQMQQKTSQENASKLYAEWMDQAESAKAIYPSFDLNSEMQNPKFLDLLRSHIDVKTAYEVIHKDEILPAAMQFAANSVSKKLANKIMSGGRPSENGTKAQAPTLVKQDPSTWTKADRQEVIRRVARGEKIRL